MDRESAREMLAERMEKTAPAESEAEPESSGAKKAAKGMAAVAGGALVGATRASA